MDEWYLNGKKITEKQLREYCLPTIMPKKLKEQHYIDAGAKRLIDAGMPLHDLETQRATWEIQFIDEIPTKVWTVENLSQTELDQLFSDKKNHLKKQITQRRKQIEEGHPTIDTTLSGQQRLAGIWSAMQLDSTREIDFKGMDGWVKINKTQVDAIAATVTQWVQDCFSREKVLHEAVDAATNSNELDAIDIFNGWPIA